MADTLQQNLGLEDGQGDQNDITANLPSTLGGIMANAGAATQAVAPGAPPPAAAPAPAPRRGGVLGGLIGVLLDGLSAGARTPQGPQGFSQSAAAGAAAPMVRQQQQITLKSQQDALNAQLAQSHVQALQTRLMAASLTDELESGMTDAAWKFATNAVEQGGANIVGGVGTREAAASKLKDLHDQNPGKALNYFMYPASRDKDGNSQWAVYEFFPNNALKEDTYIDIPGDESSGVPAIHQLVPARTPISVYTNLGNQLGRDQVAKIRGGMQANKPDAQAPDPSQISTFVQSTVPGYSHLDPGERNALVNEAKTVKTNKDFEALQNRALTLEGNASNRAVAQANAASARQQSRSDRLASKGIDDINKLWTDQQHGFGQTLSQANLGKNLIKAGADGSGLATSLVPTMEALGLSSFAGVHRISPTEAAAAGAPGGWAERTQAWLDKSARGRLTDQLAKEGNQLFDEMIRAKHSQVLQSSRVIAKNAGLDGSEVTVLGLDGNPDTLANQVKANDGGLGRKNAAQQRAAQQGIPVRVGGKIVGYTTDGKTMTPAGSP